MTTHILTTNPARTDHPDLTPPTAQSPHSRRWALSGLAAGVIGGGALVASYAVSALFDPAHAGDTGAIADALVEQKPAMLAFHVLETVAAVLLAVFALGLHRRLRTALPDSLAPGVAAFGLLGTSVLMIVATSLDTEFVFGLGTDRVSAESAVLYNHWLASVPGVWVLAGLSGLAVFAASRRGGAPRWVGRVGLVLGGLTLLTGASPLQYLAVVPGLLLVLALGLGFCLGDRR